MSYEQPFARLSSSDKTLNKLTWPAPTGELLNSKIDLRSEKPEVVYELGKVRTDSLTNLDKTLPIKPTSPILSTAASTPVLNTNKSLDHLSPALTPLPVSPGLTFQDLEESLSDVDTGLIDDVFDDINQQQLKQEEEETIQIGEVLTQAVAHVVQPPQVGNPVGQNQGPQVVNEHDNVGPQPQPQPQLPAIIQAPAAAIQPAAQPQLNLPAVQNNDQGIIGDQPQDLEPQVEEEDEMSEEKTIAPATFSGKTEEGAENWLRHFQNYCAYKGYPDQKKLQLFKVLMVQNAALWMDALTETIAGDLTQLIAAFGERYKTPQILKYRCSQELFNRRQQENESVDDFIAHLKKLSRIVEAEDKMTIMAIMNGLKPNIKLYVMQQKPENLDALLQAARVAEVTAPSQGPQEGILMQELAEMKTEMRKLGAKNGTNHGFSHKYSETVTRTKATHGGTQGFI